MTRAQQIGVIIGLAIVAVLTLLRASDPQLLRSIRDVTFDEYQRVSPRSFEELPVRVIDIDEASLREFGASGRGRETGWLCSSTGCPRWVRRRSLSTFSLPSRTGFRHGLSSAMCPASIRRCCRNCRTMTRFSADTIADKPVVLGFGLTNEGTYRPSVKAGFAFTGESPVGAPPHINAATPLRPRLEANAAGIGHISLNPGSSSLGLCGQFRCF